MSATTPPLPPPLPPLLHRRRLLTRAAVLALPAALGALGAPAARADEKYPARPITLIVPQAPGGGNDAIARIVAQKLGEQTGQGVIVQNITGAGGNVGMAAAAKAKPDGYTLVLTADNAAVINPALYKNTGFDTLRDFEPVATVATAGYVLVAHPGFAPKTVAELVAAAKAQPGKITLASAGNGTFNHLIGELLQREAGIEMLHVPYKGAAAAVTDTVGGQVQVSVQSLPSSIAFIKAGKLRVLGVVNPRRLPALPDAPTIGETLKGFGQTPWYGVFAPAGTPAAVVQTLAAELGKAVDSPEVRDKLAAVGCEPWRTGPAAFAALVRAELPKWAKAVKDSGATID